MSQRALSEAGERRLVERAVLEDLSTRELARYYHISVATVHSIMKAHGYRGRRVTHWIKED